VPGTAPSKAIHTYAAGRAVRKPNAPTVRAIPQGPITRPERGIPVVAILRWHYGQLSEVTATAWTRAEVEITWTTLGRPAAGLDRGRRDPPRALLRRNPAQPLDVVCWIRYRYRRSSATVGSFTDQ
jgi:hypothetical protein